MNRSPLLPVFLGLPMAIAATMISFDSPRAVGQTLPGLRQGPVKDAFNVQGTRIDEQRVQRQSEVARLEKIIGRFESRVTRLERQLLTMSRVPGITIAEAEAGVDFANVQLKESQQNRKKGEISEVQVASDRLAVARALGQLQAAKAAHADSLIALELDVLYAQRNLAEQNREKSQLERMAAKGYISSEGLRLLMLDVGLAEKQLQLARLRLETLKKSAGSVSSESEVDQDDARVE